MLPIVFLLNVMPGRFSCLTPPDSDTIQIHQYHRCSSQSNMFNMAAAAAAAAVQNGRSHGRTYKAK